MTYILFITRLSVTISKYKLSIFIFCSNNCLFMIIQVQLTKSLKYYLSVFYASGASVCASTYARDTCTYNSTTTFLSLHAIYVRIEERGTLLSQIRSVNYLDYQSFLYLFLTLLRVIYVLTWMSNCLFLSQTSLTYNAAFYVLPNCILVLFVFNQNVPHLFTNLLFIKL